LVKANSRKRVAVLGAGILGSCVALMLARRGISVDLFDLESAPMCGASRWNEGKIHLGYLYGADTTLETARHLIPGGLAFAPLLQDLIEQPVSGHITQSDDIFLIHRDSVIGAEQASHYYHRVSELLRSHSGASNYLADVRSAIARPVTPAELSSIADPALVQAGFHVPERSVQTNWIADQLCAALAAQPHIRQRMNTLVTGVGPVASATGPWRVVAEDVEAAYDFVVNALWHGRIDIDRSAGIEPPVEWSNRYRLSLFVQTRKAFALSSAVLAVGPFGDVKNYNGRDFYLSWYPAGLLSESENSSPDLRLPENFIDTEKVIAGIRAGLHSAFQGIEPILQDASAIRLAGGYVFAQGRGSLASVTSTLHRRDRSGVVRLGHYYSIDTGKYSIAPWLADAVAREIAGD
jgi:glycine/D-amino acid oxidase-like deaminating enzyme